MRRVLPLMLVALAGCPKAAPETEEQALAREGREADAEMKSLRARGYGAVRNAVPEGEVTVKGATVNTSELAGLFAVAYVLSGHRHLAYYEAMRVKEEDIPAEARAGLYIVRGYCYASLGWRRLARTEFDRAAPPAEDTSARAVQIRKIVRYAMVYLHVQDKDFKAATAEVMAARELFEGDPVGELCIALAHTEKGEWDKAADALDRAIASGRLDAATAGKVKAMAAELRESKNALGLLFKRLAEKCADAEAFAGLKSKYAETLEKIRGKAKALAEKARP